MILAESAVVGAYCALLSLVVDQPFAFGVCKHLFGYAVGLHSRFCALRCVGTRASVPWSTLGVESCVEGACVAILCAFLGRTPLAFLRCSVALCS